MNMGRTGARDIVKNLFRALQEGEKTVGALVDYVGADWKATKSYLDSLEEVGVVSHRKDDSDGRKKIYYLETDVNAGDTETGSYFNLEVDRGDEALARYIYQRIEERLEEQGKRVGNTWLHKLLSVVNDKLDLGLPVAWYMYGEMCVVDPGARKGPDLETPQKISGLDQAIDETLEDYSDIHTTTELIDRRYAEKDKKLYLIKEDLDNKHLSGGVEDLKKAPKKLYRLLHHIPDIEEDETLNMIDEFIGIASDIANNIETEERLRRIRSELLGAFESVWRLIALHNYKKELQEKGFYPENILELKFQPDIIAQKEEVDERLQALSEMVPQPEPPSGSDFEKFRGIAPDAKERTEEEKKQILDEKAG